MSAGTPHEICRLFRRCMQAGCVPGVRKNSASVMPERIRGKSTADTSWSGTPARKS